VYRQLIDFYRRVGVLVRIYGLKLIVETQAVVPRTDPLGQQMWTYYESLTLSQYTEARAQTARTIVENMRPDFIVVMCEPGTESKISGQPDLATLEGATQLVRLVAARAKSAGHPGLKIGAGHGSWPDEYLSFVHAFLADPSVDFYNIHTYPVIRDFLPRCLEIAQVARSYGKSVAMGESWLHKEADAETDLGLTAFHFFARNPYSFWSPLDSRFLKAMVTLAHHDKYLFYSPYFSGFFYSYLPYNDQTKNLTIEQMSAVAGMTANAAMLAGTYTDTAAVYAAAIR
jgi:hypothetical protein